MTTQTMDHILIDCPENRLGTVSMYTWVENVGDGARGAMAAVALMLDQVSKHASEFERGGYIANFDDLLSDELGKLHYGNESDEQFRDFLASHLTHAVPGLSLLDHRADASTLISVYGKLSGRMPEYLKVFDSKGVNLWGDQSTFRRIKDAFTGRKAPDYDASHTAKALIDTVNAYSAAVEDGDLEISPERAMAIKYAALTVKGSILENPEKACQNFNADAVVAAIDNTMIRFEDVCQNRFGIQLPA